MSMYNFKPEEIIIGVFPASSKKGMLTGKNAVGVKVTHIPTGLSVIHDTERSQHKNREIALTLLWLLVQNEPRKLECAEAEIEALEQRIKELELLLQTAEQNAAEQRDMEAKARQQRDEQVKKNAELAAQIEKLRVAATIVLNARDEDGITTSGLLKKFNELSEALSFLPHEYLAEHDREVAARAVEATIDAAIDLGYLENDAIQCKQIRDKIKSGEVEI